MVAGYVLVMGTLAIGLRLARRSARAGAAGTAAVTNGEQIVQLEKDQSVYIPAGNVHRLGNPGDVDLVIIEVQTGEYLGEDDIVRLEDQYGR